MVEATEIFGRFTQTKASVPIKGWLANGFDGCWQLNLHHIIVALNMVAHGLHGRKKSEREQLSFNPGAVAKKLTIALDEDSH